MALQDIRRTKDYKEAGLLGVFIIPVLIISFLILKKIGICGFIFSFIWDILALYWYITLIAFYNTANLNYELYYNDDTDLISDIGNLFNLLFFIVLSLGIIALVFLVIFSMLGIIK